MNYAKHIAECDQMILRLQDMLAKSRVISAEMAAFLSRSHCLHVATAQQRVELENAIVQDSSIRYVLPGERN